MLKDLKRIMRISSSVSHYNQMKWVTRLILASGCNSLFNLFVLTSAAVFFKQVWESPWVFLMIYVPGSPARLIDALIQVLVARPALAKRQGPSVSYFLRSSGILCSGSKRVRAFLFKRAALSVSPSSCQEGVGTAPIIQKDQKEAAALDSRWQTAVY